MKNEAISSSHIIKLLPQVLLTEKLYIPSLTFNVELKISPRVFSALFTVNDMHFEVEHTVYKKKKKNNERRF